MRHKKGISLVSVRGSFILKPRVPENPAFQPSTLRSRPNQPVAMTAPAKHVSKIRGASHRRGRHTAASLLCGFCCVASAVWLPRLLSICCVASWPVVYTLPACGAITEHNMSSSPALPVAAAPLISPTRFACALLMRSSLQVNSEAVRKQGSVGRSSSGQLPQTLTGEMLFFVAHA